MKNPIASTALSLVLVLGFSTQDAFAKKQDSAHPEASQSEDDSKRNTTVITVAANTETVHAAALEALASIGCKIKKDSATDIEAKRSNKVGAFVGSGGEKLFVTLKDLGNGSTEVTVVTKKTMVGIVGQKLWNEEIAQMIGDAVK